MKKHRKPIFLVDHPGYSYNTNVVFDDDVGPKLSDYITEAHVEDYYDYHIEKMYEYGIHRQLSIADARDELMDDFLEEGCSEVDESWVEHQILLCNDTYYHYSVDGAICNALPGCTSISDAIARIKESKKEGRR